MRHGLALALLAIVIVSGAGCSPPAGRGPSAADGWIAFASNREDYITHIYVMRADGSEVTRLTESRHDDRDPVWSPDGLGFAFDSGDWASSVLEGSYDIYVMNANGMRRTRLTNTLDDCCPAWSPDGTKIAYQSVRDLNSEIYVMNADGTGQTRLTNHPALDQLPAWSPDGGRIAFMSDRDGRDHIYVMNADGSGQVRLSARSKYDGSHPAWSPDGTMIAFSSRRNGVRGIYVMNADGSRPTLLTNGKGDCYDPAWSPDGKWIAFSSRFQIMAVAADGTRLTRLTKDDQYVDTDPSWHSGVPVWTHGPSSQAGNVAVAGR